MQVLVGKRAGFCMGVRRALNETLDAAARSRGRIFTYGPLIHNTQVVELLARRQVAIAQRPEDIHPGDLVVIRAHGIPPDMMDRIQARGGTVCDATCPHVTRAQNTVRKAIAAGADVIIVGDRGHAEVAGLLGFAEGRGHVVETPEEVASLPPIQYAWVVAQTTQSSETFRKVAEAARQRIPRVDVSATICGSTSGRQQEVLELAGQVDVLVVVGGRHSANTVRLVDIAREAGVRTVHVETAEELTADLFQGASVAGVTAGASTPNWIIEEVVEKLRTLGPSRPWLTALKALLSFLVVSHLLVSAGAAALAFAASRLAGIHTGPLPPFLAGLYIFAMQNLNLYLEHRQGGFVMHRRRILYERLGHVLAPLAAVSAVASLVLVYTMGLLPMLILAVSTILGGLYTVRLLPACLRWRRLKDLPGSKNVFFAGALAVVGVLLPAAAGDVALTAMPTWPLAISVVYVVTLAIARSIMLDLHDRQNDQFACRETIPVVIGPRNTRLVILAGIGLCAAAFAAAAAARQVPPSSLWHLLSLAYVALYLWLYSRRAFTQGRTFELIADGSFYIPALIALCI